jgi:hypothetical protein
MKVKHACYNPLERRNYKMQDPVPDPNGFPSPIVDLWIDFATVFCALFC